jgi:NAD(P)-dependent dehydrogenase (short-subunit alcohol dehydrogenase family)
MSRVCLITGGTQGIGQETAELLASEGWKVVISGRNRENGQEVNTIIVASILSMLTHEPQVVTKIQAAGGEAKFVQADVSTQASVKKLHEETVAAFGQLDGAVNAAAISTDSAKIGDASTEKFQDMLLTTNVLGLFWCMQEQIRVMHPKKSGHIVNLASIAGLHGVLNFGTYCATKHAVRVQSWDLISLEADRAYRWSL